MIANSFAPRILVCVGSSVGGGHAKEEVRESVVVNAFVRGVKCVGGVREVEKILQCVVQERS